MNAAATPHRSLILGGVKSGKSSHAEHLANDYVGSGGVGVTLIATATAGDSEMRARIERHKAERNPTWRAVEEPLTLARALLGIDQAMAESTQPGCIVIDCLTLWLSNLLMQDNECAMHLEINSFLQTVQDCQSRLIMVSNETNMGVTPMGEMSRRFCDEAGLLHQALGRICEHTALMVAGIPLDIKGIA